MGPTLLCVSGRPPRRVLVVEDDRALGRLVQLALGEFASEVVLARNGREALQAAEAGPFDNLAIDISLPDMSGLDVIAAARRLLPAAGIVAITGFVDVDVAIRSMKAGADDFLGKPFDAEVLWHVLGKAEANRRQRIEAEQADLYRQLAYTDALTGCPNRRFIDEFIERALEEARSRGTSLAVGYLDIDNFKLLNDFVGHDEGDQLLRDVAAALAEHVREPAVFGRFGGDEFVAVFPGSSVTEAREMLDQTKAAIARLEVLSGARMTLPTRVSAGVALFRGHQTPRDLVAEAEDRMYVDKSVTPAIATMHGTDLHVAEPALKIANLKALRNLVKAIDRRDSYTRYHSDHATSMAVACGQYLGLDADQMNALSIGGPIHDLGKIVVPDEILRKPGPLTAAERHTMEEHPVMGAAITAAVTDYDTVVDLVRHHHERFDGAGYPGGLRGTETGLTTRLFSLADAYSAMTTDRPYRRGLAPDRALSEIAAGRGTQFDPDLAVAFIHVVEAHLDQLARSRAA